MSSITIRPRPLRLGAAEPVKQREHVLSLLGGDVFDLLGEYSSPLALSCLQLDLGYRQSLEVVAQEHVEPPAVELGTAVAENPQFTLVIVLMDRREHSDARRHPVLGEEFAQCPDLARQTFQTRLRERAHLRALGLLDCELGQLDLTFVRGKHVGRERHVR